MSIAAATLASSGVVSHPSFLVEGVRLMSRITPLICFLCLVLAGNIAYAQVTATVSSDGYVVLSGTDLDLIGIDLMSAGGHLIPIPNDDASPFSFLLKNVPTQITYGNLVGSVRLDGELKLSAGYEVTDVFDLNGQWGATGAGNDGAIAFPNPPIVPEPGTFGLMLTAMLSIGLFRRRSRNH